MILGFILAVSASTTPTQAAEAPPCPPRWGQPGKPLVPDARTARNIFLAVEDSFHPTADRKNFPAVEATDEGDHWGVFRWKPPVRTSRGLAVTEGGGQLEMQIAKCDAAISEVYFSK
jgi:hypothetical protein